MIGIVSAVIILATGARSGLACSCLNRRSRLFSASARAPGGEAARIEVTTCFPQRGKQVRTPVAYYVQEFERRMVGLFRKSLNFYTVIGTHGANIRQRD